MFLNFASSETKNDNSTLIKVLLLALFLAVGKGVAWAQVVAADDIQQLQNFCLAHTTVTELRIISNR